MSAEKSENEIVTRIYEAGYTIVPTVKEEDVEKVVSDIRAEIEKMGGTFIAEGAPSLIKLAFAIEAREGEKRVAYDRGYFGWLKFEAGAHTVSELTLALKANNSILRALVFKTVREDTRAKFKAPQIREVKRTDTIKTVRAPLAEEKGEVSEVDLEKALETLTAE